MKGFSFLILFLISVQMFPEEPFSFRGKKWGEYLYTFSFYSQNSRGRDFVEFGTREDDGYDNKFYFKESNITVAGYPASIQYIFLAKKINKEAYPFFDISNSYSTFEKAIYVIHLYDRSIPSFRANDTTDINQYLKYFFDLNAKLQELYGKSYEDNCRNLSINTINKSSNNTYYYKWNKNGTIIELKLFSIYSRTPNVNNWYLYILYKSPNYDIIMNNIKQQSIIQHSDSKEGL